MFESTLQSPPRDRQSCRSEQGKSKKTKHGVDGEDPDGSQLATQGRSNNFSRSTRGRGSDCHWGHQPLIMHWGSRTLLPSDVSSHSRRRVIVDDALSLFGRFCQSAEDLLLLSFRPCFLLDAEQFLSGGVHEADPAISVKPIRALSSPGSHEDFHTSMACKPCLLSAVLRMLEGRHCSGSCRCDRYLGSVQYWATAMDVTSFISKGRTRPALAEGGGRRTAGKGEGRREDEKVGEMGEMGETRDNEG